MSNLIAKDHSLMSTEVAEMVEKEHKNLLRDIKRYNNQLNGSKIEPVDFWKDSTYIDNKGEERPCYLITKKGCEFIAHKMTGAKGTVFTARYINRFHEMEDIIRAKTPVPELECNYQTTTPCPVANPFYAKFSPIIELVCSAAGITKKEFYFRLMRHLSKEFDLVEARNIYIKERGHAPAYDADIIGYFPELTKAGEKFIWDFIFG